MPDPVEIIQDYIVGADRLALLLERRAYRLLGVLRENPALFHEDRDDFEQTKTAKPSDVCTRAGFRSVRARTTI